MSRANMNRLNKPIYVYKADRLSQKGVFKKLIKEKVIQETGKGTWSYKGVAQKLMGELDASFLNLFKGFNADDVSYPATIHSNVLSKAGYFKNFSNIVEFIGCAKESRRVKVTKKMPADNARKVSFTNNVLLPAACLPCYAQLSNSILKEGLFVVTTKNRVFRNEAAYQNIFRMNEFDMREIVFLGNKQEVMDALRLSTEIIKSFAMRLNITFALNRSTDLFYGENSDLKSLFQLLAQSKIELRAFCRDLNKYIPISSINYHGTHFGRVFGIAVKKGPVHTGCVAFGLQRWALILLNLYGTDIKEWPRMSVFRR